jgi:hypothetical protein
MAADAGGKDSRAHGNEAEPVVAWHDQTAAAAERITVALIPKASEDLQRLQDRTGLSKTDIANRAITAYEFFESKMRNGNDLLVRDPETGEIQIVKFL